MPRASRNFLETPHPARAAARPQASLCATSARPSRASWRGTGPRPRPSPGAADKPEGKSQMPGAPGTDLPRPGPAEGAADRTSASRAPPSFLTRRLPSLDHTFHLPLPPPALGPSQPAWESLSKKSFFFFPPAGRAGSPPARGLAASPRAGGHLGPGVRPWPCTPPRPRAGAAPRGLGLDWGCPGPCQGGSGYPASSRAGPADAGPTREAAGSSSPAPDALGSRRL